MKKEIVLIAGVVALLSGGAAVYAFCGDSGKGNVIEDTVQIAEDSIDSKQAAGMGQSEEAEEVYDNCSYIGFIDEIPVNSPIELQNDEYNKIAGFYLQCTVYVGDEECYQTDLIEPGKSVIVTLGDYIEIEKDTKCTIVEQAFLKNDDGTFVKTAVPVSQAVLLKV